jgi:hypothetical protein
VDCKRRRSRVSYYNLPQSDPKLLINGYLDSSHDVRSYVMDFLHAAPGHDATSSAEVTRPAPRRPKFATFSRPPPPSSAPPLSSHPDAVEDEIRRRLTRSATDDNGIEMGDINSPSRPTSTLHHASVPEDDRFPQQEPVAEFLRSQPDSPIAVSG